MLYIFMSCYIKFVCSLRCLDGFRLFHLFSVYDSEYLYIFVQVWNYMQKKMIPHNSNSKETTMAINFLYISSFPQIFEVKKVDNLTFKIVRRLFMYWLFLLNPFLKYLNSNEELFSNTLECTFFKPQIPSNPFLNTHVIKIWFFLLIRLKRMKDSVKYISK